MRNVQLSTTTAMGLVAAAALFAVTGCTVNGPDPAPESASAPTGGEGQSSRPRELSIAGKQDSDLCGLLSAEQQTQLGVAGPHPGGLKEEEVPGCGWLSPAGSEPGFGVTIAAFPMGIQEFQDQKVGEPFPETAAEYAVSGGFPAQQSQSGQGLENMGCKVAVDVAEGQTLLAFANPSVMGTIPHQQLCDKAKQTAEQAVTTLQSQG